MFYKKYSNNTGIVFLLIMCFLYFSVSHAEENTDSLNTSGIETQNIPVDKIEGSFQAKLPEDFYAKLMPSSENINCTFREVMSTSDLMCASTLKNLKLAQASFDEYNEYTKKGESDLAKKELLTARNLALKAMKNSGRIREHANSMGGLLFLSPPENPIDKNSEEAKQLDESLKSNVSNSMKAKSFWLAMDDVFNETAKNILENTGGIPDDIPQKNKETREEIHKNENPNKEESSDIVSDLKSKGLSESSKFVNDLDDTVKNMRKDAFGMMSKIFQVASVGCNAPVGCGVFSELKKISKEKAGDRAPPPDHWDVADKAKQTISNFSSAVKLKKAFTESGYKGVATEAVKESLPKIQPTSREDKSKN